MTTYNHPEAFCLMIYATADHRQEVLWNSRDGVTPFCLDAIGSPAEMQHVQWQRDTRAVDHLPDDNQRVFVDMTPDDAREQATAWTERLWSKLSDRYESKAALIEEKTAELTGDVFIITGAEWKRRNPEGLSQRERHPVMESMQRSAWNHGKARFA